MPRVPSQAAAYIGSRIAKHRTLLSLTQDELAVRAGIESSNIRAYESGRGIPSIHTLVRIAFALEIDPGELLDGISLELFSEKSGDKRRRAG